MRSVGIRELKNRLSEYLRAVRRGETVLVTDRGQVIAEIRRPGSGPGTEAWPPGLAAMVREGAARPPRPSSRDAYPPQPRRVPDGTAGRLLEELRGEQ